MKVQRLVIVASNKMAEINEAVVCKLYAGEGLTTRQMAAVLGVGQRTAARLLHRYGIAARDKGAPKIPQLQDQQWLVQKYEVERLSTVAIARELGCSPRTVYEGLTRFGIKPRPRNQHSGRKFSAAVRRRMSDGKRGRFLGESNPNWKGGRVDPTARERRSYKAKMWRNAVKARDGHKCVDCGSTNRLHAHHIRSWKDAPELRFELSNGKTLCVICHQKTHGFPFPAWLYEAK